MSDPVPVSVPSSDAPLASDAVFSMLVKGLVRIVDEDGRVFWVRPPRRSS